MLNLGRLGPRMLTFLVQVLSHNILVDIIFFIWKSLWILRESGGPWQRGTIVSVSPGISFSSSFYFHNNQVESTEIGNHNAPPPRFVPSFPILLGLQQECPLPNSRWTRPRVKSSCFMGKPCLSWPHL